MDRGRSSTVLIVDDEPEFRATLSRVLEHEGYAIRLAHPDPQAIRVEDAHRPDVVILELGRPRSSGLKFLRELREVPGWSHVPVIVLTSHERNPDIEEARKLGIRGHLVMMQFSTRSLRSAVRASVRCAFENTVN